MKKILICIFSLTLLVVFAGCAKKRTVSHIKTEKLKYKKIAILPFFDGTKLKKHEERAGRTSKLPLDATLSAHRIFFEELDARQIFKIVPLKNLPVANRSSDKITQFISELKLKKLGDALIIGHVYSFQDRLGTGYAADRGAHVAFMIEVYDISTGQIIFKKNINRTQKSLMEDLTKAYEFFTTGSKWLTREELTRVLMEKLIDEIIKRMEILSASDQAVK